MKRVGLLACVCLLLAACPAAPSDPPPPPRRAEILPAPPRALGAHAAGTDAAPRPEAGLSAEDESPAAPLLPPTEAAPDGGAAPQAPGPGVLPDAGMAL